MKILYLESNPLDEFSVNFYTYMVALKYTSHLSSIYIQVNCFSLIILIIFFPWKNYLIPNNFQHFKESIFEFILNFIKDKNISLRSTKYLVLYINLFLFILISNLSGLIHYNQLITAHLIVAFFLALVFFVFLLTIGVALYKIYFYKIIEPENVPKSLFILILIIEFFSFLIRPFSLAIRLFANMLAGHLLLMLVGIFILFICKFWILFAPFFISTILISLNCLEFAICFIQSYVFLILFLTYIEEVYKLFYST